jgi:two-component system, chemotaxis family, protein-glutamate methylesterase/glutaminase
VIDEKTSSDRKIGIMIVDDSATARLLLRSIFEEAGFKVVGEAANGRNAIKLLKTVTPDIITMDLMMPDMDGFKVTRQILKSMPVPIIIVSSWSDNHERGLKALEAGALAIVEKPGAPESPRYESMKKNLLQTAQDMSEVKVVARRSISDLFSFKNAKKTIRLKPPVRRKPIVLDETEIAVIGISTGGPPLLVSMLKQLPADFPLPICIVQHILGQFTDSLVSWLSSQCKMPVEKISEYTSMRAGHIYIAPGGRCVKLRNRLQFVITAPLSDTKPAPSINDFFDSVNQFYGSAVVAMLMTGMGRDGVDGLKRLSRARACTIAQSPETCAVAGMPSEAIKANAAKLELTPDEIVKFLMDVRRF